MFFIQSPVDVPETKVAVSKVAECSDLSLYSDVQTVGG